MKSKLFQASASRLLLCFAVLLSFYDMAGGWGTPLIIPPNEWPLGIALFACAFLAFVGLWAGPWINPWLTVPVALFILAVAIFYPNPTFDPLDRLNFALLASGLVYLTFTDRADATIFYWLSWVVLAICAADVAVYLIVP